VAVGPHAADMLASVAVAIQMHATVDDLAPILPLTHPQQ
jgi:pyruvate/2-oxoglutarate dehydrogenase complex dihydrolipoamide dehydrogenase (E3) component